MQNKTTTSYLNNMAFSYEAFLQLSTEEDLLHKLSEEDIK